VEVPVPGKGPSPSIVPYGADQTVYLVIDRLDARGTADREIEVERSNIETIIIELMCGQFNDPVRIVAFNTLEHWSDDVTAEVAAEIQTRCDIDGEPVPEHLKEFMARQVVSTRQQMLRTA
jgi:hypothetical protein